MNDYAFAVDAGLVSRLTELVGELVERSTYSMVTAPPDEFPAWCAALGVESFIAYRGKIGHTWIGTNHSYTWCNQRQVHAEGPDEGLLEGCRHDHRIVSVTCDTPPAPWVEFPSGQGDRRYMFRVA